MMKKTWVVLSALVLLLLIGAGPCERSMPDSINPVNKFKQSMTGGEKLSIYEAVSYYLGFKLDPATIDDTTVILRQVSDGSEVPGLISMFDPVDCALPGGSCPRGVGFTPNDGMTCALQGDTLYELVLDGVLRADGTPITADGSSLHVTFRTKPVPDGDTPDFCSGAAPWWVIDYLHPTDGLTLGIAGDPPFVIIVTGVEAMSPWNGYDQPYETTIQLGVWDYVFSFVVGAPASPPYIPMLVIQNTGGGAYDLSLLADGDRMVGLTDNLNNYMPVKLPPISIPADESLFLYVGADGSSYYAYDDSGTHTYDSFDWYPPYMLDPPTAFAAGPAASW